MKKVVVVVKGLNPYWLIDQIQHVLYMQGCVPPAPELSVEFEGKNLTVFNNADGMLIIKEVEEVGNHLGVFNKENWLYWKKIE